MSKPLHGNVSSKSFICRICMICHSVTACPTAFFCDENVDFWVDGLKISNLTKRKFHHVLLISFDQISLVDVET